MAAKKTQGVGSKDTWYEPTRTVENGVWLLKSDEIGRTKEPVFDLKQLRLDENTNRAWIITTEHGAVLIETWKRSPESSSYIEYQMWIGEYRYWQRKKDEYRDDAARIKSAEDFARLVLYEIARVQHTK